MNREKLIRLLVNFMLKELPVTIHDATKFTIDCAAN